jgi:hypothetical protein
VNNLKMDKVKQGALRSRAAISIHGPEVKSHADTP